MTLDESRLLLRITAETPPSAIGLAYRQASMSLHRSSRPAEERDTLQRQLNDAKVVAMTGAEEEPCPICYGKGKIHRQEGFYRVWVLCEECAGTGKLHR